MERALDIRRKIALANKCTFDLDITADYGEYFHEFGMKCEIDNTGSIIFTVTEPESISGITGKLSASGGELTFDDSVLLFPMMADGVLSPVSGPWLLSKALRGGYIKGAGNSGAGLVVQIDDTFEGSAFQINIITDSVDCPVSAEVIWQGRRVLAMLVENFQIM